MKAFDYLGSWRYFVTTCTQRRQRVFADASSVNAAIEQILKASCAERCEILAYCFMPDHLHLLVAGTDDDASFLRFIKLAKQRSGWRHRQETGTTLWQEGYHERILRDDEPSIDVIAYIVANPIRAGLVASCDEYPFWGSAIYSRAEILQFVGVETRRS